MLPDFLSLNCRRLIYKVGLRASHVCVPTCHMSGTTRGQCVGEVFRNHKALQGVQLFFSSGCNPRDEGGGEGVCATRKEVPTGGEAGQITVPANRPFPGPRQEPASCAERRDTHSGDACLPGSPT